MSAISQRPALPMRTFGDFELLEEIGRGAMGLVFRARQVSLDRTVALKIVRAGGLASEQEQERFQREAQALARLRHPNIVAIHEVGEHDGQPFFAMDFVEGKNLAEVIREGPVAPAEAAALVRRVAEAVHFAHQEGTLHRDLKPSNVLLDAAGQPRITDFGIAKRLHGDVTLTLSGEMVGTPGYMPPEQMGGTGMETLPASDVYSLGAILYELVTGRRPFDIESTLDAVMQIMHREPDSPRALQPDLDRDIETICLKCLEKEPSRRYASARELADDLGRYVRHEPLMARPVTLPERALRWCLRNPWPSVAGIALIMLSIVSVYSALTLRERLWLSLVEQARAERLAGRRSSSLERIAEAARIERSAELREEALRTLITPGVEAVEMEEPAATWDPAEAAFVAAAELAEKASGLENLPARAAPLASFSEDELLVLERQGLVSYHLPSSESELLTVPPVAVSADGRVAVVPEGFGVTVLRLPEKTALCYLPLDPYQTLRPESPRAARLLLSPAGALLAVQDAEPWARDVAVTSLWDLAGTVGESSRLISRIVLEPGSRLNLHEAAFNPDGTLLAALGAVAATGFVGIWDVRTGAEVERLEGHRTPRWSADGDLLATTGPEGAVFAWKVVPPPPRYALSRQIFGLGFSPDGDRLAAGMTLWDVHRSSRWMRLVRSGDDLRGNFLDFDRDMWVWRVELAGPIPDWPMAVVGSEDGSELVLHHPGHPDPEYLATALFADVSPDGRYLAVTGRFVPAFEDPAGEAAIGSFLDVWDLASEPVVQSWSEHVDERELGPVVFSSDGDLLAVVEWGADADEVVLWDAATGRPLRTLGHGGEVTHMVFSLDGRLVASAAESGKIDVSEASTGKKLRSWSSPVAGLSSLALSPDGTYAATGSADRTITLWQVATGKELIRWRGHSGPVTALAFDPGGETLASGGADGHLRLWHLPSFERGLTELGLDWPATGAP